MATTDYPCTLLRGFLLGALLSGLGGCTSTLPKAPTAAASGNNGAVYASAYTPAEQQLRKESNQFAKTSLQGCLAGAAAGALVGLLASRDRNKGLLIGAAGGCAAGFATNAYVQQKRGQYRNNEARVNAMIADVRADNQKLAGMISTTRQVIADDRQRIAKINAGIRNRELSASQARVELARVKENRRLLGNSIEQAEKKYEDWNQIAAMERQTGANTARLDSEIQQLKQKVVALEKEAELIDREIAAVSAPA
ncbi:MAG: hypothetical protein N838_23780 [Thiohalocapsa sp. PB-PSB1]|nr:MAG: hypothetical protein N838_23780 [Thiohalocapsa sp. PB-PSB1]